MVLHTTKTNHNSNQEISTVSNDCERLWICNVVGHTIFVKHCKVKFAHESCECLKTESENNALKKYFKDKKISF